MNVLRILKSKNAQNAGWLIAGRIAQMLISLVVGIITTRYLGPSNYGLINYIGAYTSFFAAFCTLGINSVIVNELVNHRDSEGTVLGTAVFLKSISSILSAIMIVAIVSMIDAGKKTIIVLAIICSIGMVLNVLETFKYWFQSHLKSKISAIAAFLGYVVVSIYRVILIISGKNVVFFGVATSLDYLFVGLFLIISYYRSGGGRIRVSLSYGKQLFRKSCHFILPALMISVYAQTDKFMLKRMIGPEEIGYYSTAVNLCTMWCFVLSAIIESFSPTIMEYYSTNKIEDFNKKNKQLYAIVFYLSIFVSVIICLFAYPIVGILYGKKFLPVVFPLRIITWYTAFSYLGVARDTWVVCKNVQKYLIYIYASAAAANIALNLCLIPHFGASGAAIASLASQIVTTMVTPFFIKDLRPNSVLMIKAIMLRDVLFTDKKHS